MRYCVEFEADLLVTGDVFVDVEPVLDSEGNIDNYATEALAYKEAMLKIKDVDWDYDGDLLDITVVDIR